MTSICYIVYKVDDVISISHTSNIKL